MAILKLEPLVGKFITGPDLRRLCGDVSDMTIWRWQRDPTLNFPRALKIRRRNYFRESEILEWLEARAAEPQSAGRYASRREAV